MLENVEQSWKKMESANRKQKAKASYCDVVFYETWNSSLVTGNLIKNTVNQHYYHAPWRLPIEDQMSSHVIFPGAGANTSGDRR